MDRVFTFFLKVHQYSDYELRGAPWLRNAHAYTPEKVPLVPNQNTSTLKVPPPSHPPLLPPLPTICDWISLHTLVL